VIGSSRFRSRGRIPVLSYLYKENNVSSSTVCCLGWGGAGMQGSPFFYSPLPVKGKDEIIIGGL